MPRVAKALVCFVDNSYLYVELSKKPEAGDSMLLCWKIIGLPENAPADKPTMAAGITRTASAGNCIEMHIPMARITCVSIQQEFLGKEVPNDMEELWK